MGHLTVLTLRVVLAVALAGSLFVQAVMVPLLWIDLDGAPTAVRVPVVVIVVLGIVTMQVSAVCVWRLLTMVRRGTVFSPAAFRYVDVVFGSIAAAAVLTFVLAVVLAPGEAVAPGIVLLVAGVGGGRRDRAAGARAAGAAGQGRRPGLEAHQLRAELDEVI